MPLGAATWPPNDGRVALRQFDTAQRAINAVTDRYAYLAQTNPVLSNNLSPATPEDLQHWHAQHQLWAITSGMDTVGVFAVAPGSIGWLSGQEINEEIVAVAHAGQRYATSAQCAWAHSGFVDTTDLLIGTIDRHNHVSRTTAERAGRPRVLDDIFIALDASAGRCHGTSAI
jgi:hypothetical protein